MWVRCKWPQDLEVRNAVLRCKDKCLRGVCLEECACYSSVGFCGVSQRRTRSMLQKNIAEWQLGREWVCMWHSGFSWLCCPIRPECHTMLDFADMVGSSKLG